MGTKNICILKQRLGQTGGLEKSTLKIAEGFAQKGHRVSLICSSKEPQDLPSYLNYIKINLESLTTFLQVLEFDHKVNQFLKENHFDIVFGMERNTLPTHVRLGNGIHRAYLDRRNQIEPLIKQLITKINPLHHLLLHMEKKTLENPNLKKIITNSHMVARELSSYYNADEKKVQVIHNGVEWHQIEKDFNSWLEVKHKSISLFSLDSSKFQLLFVGHGFKRKGLLVLLEALALMPHRDFHLHVVGKDKNLSFYQKKASTLALFDHVTFHGEQKNIKMFYQIADCVVIPSYYDPFANVTVEALAMGIPVISSLYNGGAEILSDEIGYKVESLQDPHLLKEALEASFEKPKTWSRSIKIRESVKGLDFSFQIGKLVDACLHSC